MPYGTGMNRKDFRSDKKKWQESIDERYLVVTLFVVDCNAPHNVDSWVNFKIEKEVNKKWVEFVEKSKMIVQDATGQGDEDVAIATDAEAMGLYWQKLVAVDAVRTLDHSIKCKEVRKWTAIAAERSTMMRRHHVMFAKAAQETQTAKSSDYRINWEYLMRYQWKISTQ